MAKKKEISVALWALWLRKDFASLCLLYTLKMFFKTVKTFLKTFWKD